MAFFDLQGQALRHRLFAPPDGYSVTPSQGGPLQRLPDGGFASAGAVSYSNAPANGQLWRFSATGDTLWVRTFRQAGNLGTILNNVVYLPADSGFALVGSQRQTTNQSDLILLRTDQNGRERWRRTYRQPGQRYHNSAYVSATPDGGFLVCGYSAPNSGNGFFFNGDWLVVKTDATGQEQWRYTLATPYHEGCTAGIHLPDGGYLLSGFIGRRFNAQSTTDGQPLLVRLDAQGREIWRRAYGPINYGTAAGLPHLLPDGSAVLGGQFSLPPQQPNFFENVGFGLKICAATGDSIWWRTYRYFNGPDTRHYLRDFTPTPDGGFVGTGFIHLRAPDVGPQSIWLFKTDANGYLQPGGTPPPAVACPLLAVTPDIEKPQVALYPNPTLPDGRFTLDAPAGATLVLTDALGREVWRTSHRSPLTSNLKLPHAGLYLLRLTWPDGRTATRKVVRD